MRKEENRKLVFLDIDGTILPGNRPMTKKVRQALGQAKENGHYLCICSGRAYSEIPGQMKKFDGVVSAAGACIIWKGQLLLAEYLSCQELENVAGLLEEAGATYIMEGYEHLYMKKEIKKNILELLRKSSKEERRALRFFYSTRSCSSLKYMKKVHKCSYFYANQDGEWFREKLKKWDMSLTAFSQGETRGYSGEITKAAFDKGSAVQYLSSYLDIPIEDTIAIGDSENDKSMLQAAGIGIAMGNATDDVKEAADDVTGSVDEDGVYDAFQKYRLIF